MNRKKTSGPVAIIINILSALNDFGVIKFTEIINKIYDISDV